VTVPPDLRSEVLVGCLSGLAIGDSLLLSFEKCTRRSLVRFKDRPLEQGLCCRRGMLSDDTEHAVFVLQAWIRSEGDLGRFQRSLAWRLRWWLLCLPAGIGKATLRSIVRLWLGWSPECSGVSSGGNGTLMRAPVLGVLITRDRAERWRWVDASSRLTHRDAAPRIAARAVAEVTAWLARREESPCPWTELAACGPDDHRWIDLLDLVRAKLDAGAGVQDLADAFGFSDGVPGYSYFTIGLALFAFLQHRSDPASGMRALRDTGGDTDTVGAIAGSFWGTGRCPAATWTPWLVPLPARDRFRPGSGRCIRCVRRPSWRLSSAMDS